MPPVAVRQLTPLLDRLAELDSGVRPVRADGLHLTLRFLGTVDPEAEAAIRGIASQVARETQAFAIWIQGRGVFVEGERPRVVWADVGEGREELERMAAEIDRGLIRSGCPVERRPFQPHFTLARVVRPLAAGAGSALAAFCDQGIEEPPILTEVQRLALLESVAVPGGPNRYPALASWELRPR